MELKVWVEGIQRIVCGVTVNTTCQDVVFALAHATGKVGRFTLIERWRNNERHLAPNENPLKLLLKWGEYANDVQFILQRSESKQVQQGNQTNCNASTTTTASPTTAATAPIMQANAKKPLGLSNSSNNNNNPSNKMECIPNALQKQKSNIELSYKSKELKKSFGAYDTKHIENIGIVKGVPQQQPHQQQQQHTTAQQLLNASNQKSPTITNNNNNSNNNNNNNSTHNSPVPQMMMIPKHEKSHSNPIEMTSTQTTNVYNDYYDYNSSNNNNNNNNHIYSQLGAHHSKSINEINLAEVRNALDRRGSPSNSPNELYYNHNNINNNSSMTTTNNNNANINNNNTSHENLLEIYANTSSSNNNTPYNASPDLYKQTPTISANGALVPPPYRDPPPPRNSPMQRAETISNSSTSTTAPPPVTTLTQNPFLNSDYNCNNEYEYEFKQFGNSGGNVNNGSVGMDETEGVFQVTQYNDLLQLIKFQREKISTQQLELNKFDAEIVFLETKERDQAQELEAISREITKADQIFRQGSEQLQTLQYVEEENELVKQQEKTLKSEITLLRSKLTNCETELLQCKNKIRILMDDVEIEQRAVTQKQKSNRQNVERDFLIEMERIQSEIDQALHSTDTSNKTADNLKKELVMIENAIAEKKRQVEQLVNEMKEVNLQSLTVTTTEEIKHLLEGTNKQGSARRIIGSPRQLENAVPTSKNPHGVWV